MSKTAPEIPIVETATVEELESWLEAHHDEIGSVWVKVAKSGTDLDWIAFDDALNAALCFGLVNGVRREVDRSFFLQKFVPRQADTRWTWTECDKAEWLTEQGRMRPAGAAQVEAAKVDGRWDQAYASFQPVKPPDQFLARLASYPEAREFFNGLDDRNRNAILASMRTTFDPEADRLRIDKVVEQLRNHEKPY
ncbi:MAG: YdeI/OmpD-associated family protein [Thermomicrobiales bacterium]